MEGVRNLGSESLLKTDQLLYYASSYCPFRFIVVFLRKEERWTEFSKANRAGRAAPRAGRAAPRAGR